ncbi:MAG: threonine-phosphate decarboxylase [Cyanothece sp. SIO1E1]|nr:threonine-phosphate decarboxylase [Cyanothece sp. SIO1E1]
MTNHSTAPPVHGGNLAWAAALAGCSPSSILDFSASINPLGPPQSAIAAIQTHLGELRTYPDPQYQSLRKVLGQVHNLPPEWILPGNGSAELLTWASWDLSQLTTTYLLTPAFGDYFRALQAFGGSIMACTLGKIQTALQVEPSPAKLKTELPYPPFPHRHFQGIDTTNSGLLLNNPHNPTGCLFSLESMLPVLEQFALVVVDEAFMDFLRPEQQQSLIGLVQKHFNLVVLRSLTKFYSLPGLRLGYAIAHPERLQRWQQQRDPWPVNVLAMAAAEAILHDHPFQQQTWRWLTPARNQLAQALNQLAGLCPLSSAANFLLVQSDLPGTQVQAELLKKSQILIRDCLSFSELGDRFFRVAVRTEPENQRLIDGLAAIL